MSDDRLYLFKKSGAVVKVVLKHEDWMIDKKGDPDCTVRRVDSGKEVAVHFHALTPLKQIWVTDDPEETPVEVPAKMTLPYAVWCRGEVDVYKGCGKVEFGQKEYDRQMARPGATWRCPTCGFEASFDDEHFEAMNL